MSKASVMRRTIVSSFIPFIGAVVGAIAMGLAFPKANIAVLAPLGVAGLYWTWYGLTPLGAFWTGWLAGLVFFAWTWSWFGETAGSLVAPFGFLLVLGPALVWGIFLGMAGALSAIAFARAPRALAPLAAAAAFTICEWVRSSGSLGIPFSDLSYTQVETPLAPLASYVGSFGLTFVVCAIGAYLAYGFRGADKASARRTTLIAMAVILCCTSLAWLGWPARELKAPTFPVAAAQGDVRQEIKWTQQAFDISLDRYQLLTRRAAAYDPAFVLWPETAMPTNLNMVPWLQLRLSKLARYAHTELIVGSKQMRGGDVYNALYFFRSDGTLDAVYRKRHLVPFAETLPAPNILGKFPGADLVSRFSVGDTPGVLDIGGARVAPLICWESAFDDLALAGIHEGAEAFVIATDDAWFGSTAGPYQHAQIAQMRALESGTWIVRAGATGISGIIAPNGRYTVRSKLNEFTLVHGLIGPRAPTLFAMIGSLPIVLGLVFLYIVSIVLPCDR